MIERLEKLVELKAGGVRKSFASKIGVGQQAFNNYMNGTRSVTLEVINSTLNTFPELSAEWLIRGEGEMLISDNLPKFHGEETDAELELHAEIARKEIEIQKLTDLILIILAYDTQDIANIHGIHSNQHHRNRSDSLQSSLHRPVP